MKKAYEFCLENIPRYINENRFDTVQSKLGPITRENALTASEFLAKDAWSDFKKDEPQVLEVIDESKEELLLTSINSMSRTFINDLLTKKENEKK